MADHSFHVTLLRLRFAVGLLGEKAAHGWWPTSFLELSSSRFLDPVFVRTRHAAQYHGVTEAARRVHDQGLSAGSFHLFRLPAETEQDLHRLMTEWPAEGEALVPTAMPEAMAFLDAYAVGSGTDTAGKVMLGDQSVLDDGASWRRAAAVYREAFKAGFQSYPFFGRA